MLIVADFVRLQALLVIYFNSAVLLVPLGILRARVI